MLALAGGCEVPKEVNPVAIYREVTGLADAGRPPPPGLDQPFPNLAVVPPRPERPPLLEREAISAGLVADRESARGQGGRPPQPGAARAADAAGALPIPGGPPPRAALAAAPVVPWMERPPGGVAPAPAAPRQPGAAPPAVGGGRTPGQPGTPGARGSAAGFEPAPPLPTTPEMAPAPPPPDLLGPPGLPSPDLFAPPPGPSPDLLAPSSPPAAPRLR